MRDREYLASQLAATLGDKVTLLRILNMNLYEIEQNSRVERLAEFKLQFQRSRSAFVNILTAISPAVTNSDCNEFCETISCLSDRSVSFYISFRKTAGSNEAGRCKHQRARHLRNGIPLSYKNTA